MKFCLIGSGFIMPRHAQSIFETGGKITEIVTTAYGEENWKNIVDKTSADCVVVLTPNDLHASMVRYAASKGKMVLCEKPLTFNAREATALSSLPNVYTVLQLRYHPLAIKMKQTVEHVDYKNIDMDISVYRDEKYNKGWKGDSIRSGGILFNLGIHYFDLLLDTFGPAREVRFDGSDGKTANGVIQGEKYFCRWTVSTAAPRDRQKRCFFVNGGSFNFSSQDNLSYENLHKKVYEELNQGRGFKPVDALPAIRLIERIYENEG